MTDMEEEEVEWDEPVSHIPPVKSVNYDFIRRKPKKPIITTTITTTTTTTTTITTQAPALPSPRIPATDAVSIQVMITAQRMAAARVHECYVPTPTSCNGCHVDGSLLFEDCHVVCTNCGLRNGDNSIQEIRSISKDNYKDQDLGSSVVEREEATAYAHQSASIKQTAAHHDALLYNITTNCYNGAKHTTRCDPRHNKQVRNIVVGYIKVWRTAPMDLDSPLQQFYPISPLTTVCERYLYKAILTYQTVTSLINTMPKVVAAAFWWLAAQKAEQHKDQLSIHTIALLTNILEVTLQAEIQTIQKHLTPTPEMTALSSDYTYEKRQQKEANLIATIRGWTIHHPLTTELELKIRTTYQKYSEKAIKKLNRPIVRAAAFWMVAMRGHPSAQLFPIQTVAKTTHIEADTITRMITRIDDVIQPRANTDKIKTAQVRLQSAIPLSTLETTALATLQEEVEAIFTKVKVIIEGFRSPNTLGLGNIVDARLETQLNLLKKDLEITGTMKTVYLKQPLTIACAVVFLATMNMHIKTQVYLPGVIQTELQLGYAKVKKVTTMQYQTIKITPDTIHTHGPGPNGVTIRNCAAGMTKMKMLATTSRK